MGCFWGQDQGGHSGTPALSSIVVESPGQDLCWCTMLYGATSLGMRRGAGIWGCELTLHPLVMRSLDQFFFPGLTCRVLGRERAERCPAGTVSLAAGVGPGWAQRFPQPPGYPAGAHRAGAELRPGLSQTQPTLGWHSLPGWSCSDLQGRNLTLLGAANILQRRPGSLLLWGQLLRLRQPVPAFPCSFLGDFIQLLR